jgi:heme-degrading monooxygenase HmoA
MENFVITLTAQPGKEDVITQFYVELQPEYAQAKGFRGRQILRARPGTMAEHLRKVMTPEQMAQHPEPEDDGSVHFIIIEQWDSIDDRMAFSATQDRSRNAALFPNLKPAHTHEYYDDITPG